MAQDPRRLAHGEKHFSMFTSEKGRDRTDARRQIEGLNLADQQVALLKQQVDALHYIADRMASIDAKFSDLMNQRRQEQNAQAGGFPPPPPPPAG